MYIMNREYRLNTPKLKEFVVKQLDAVAFKGQGFNLKKKTG